MKPLIIFGTLLIIYVTWPGPIVPMMIGITLVAAGLLWDLVAK